jgi:hypothetical protein
MAAYPAPRAYQLWKGHAVAASKLAIPPDPTIKDVVDAIRETHDCVNDVATQVGAARSDITKLAKEIRDNRTAVSGHNVATGERIARIEGALGIRMPTKPQADTEDAPPKEPSKRFAGLSQWQAIASIVGAATGVQIIFKALEPAVVAFVTTLYHGFVH